jgi:hypothetical protein
MVFHSLTNVRYATVVTLSFIGFLLIGCPTSPPQDTDLKSGFRRIAWKSALADIEGMTSVREYGGRFVWATRDSEQLSIGNVPVDAIEYKFIDNAFSAVEIQFSGSATFKDLIRELESAWGPADLDNRQTNELVWRLEGVAAKLNYYRMPDSGTLVFVLKR